MSFTDPGHVSTMLQQILTSASVALSAADRPVDRVVRFSGVPSWDCEMLAVYPELQVGGQGTIPDSKIMRGHLKHVLLVDVLLLRCVTAVDGHDGVPAAAEVDADGDAYATDMWVLHRTLVLGAQAGTLFTSGTCVEAHSRGMRPLSPSGGLSAMTTTIEVTL